MPNGIRRIEVPGRGWIETEARPGEKSSTEIFNPEMPGGSYQDFPGGGSMEMYTEPSQSGRSPIDAMIPETLNLPPELRDREKYKQFLQSRYGNPENELGSLSQEYSKVNQNVEKTASQNERELFEHVFGGQMRYIDRRYMDSKAQSHWQNALLKYRKNIETDLKSKLDMKKADIESRSTQFEGSMKAFDEYSKTFKKGDVKPPKPSDYKTFQDMAYNFSVTENPTDAERQAVVKAGESLGINMPSPEQLKGASGKGLWNYLMQTGAFVTAGFNPEEQAARGRGRRTSPEALTPEAPQSPQSPQDISGVQRFQIGAPEQPSQPPQPSQRLPGETPADYLKRTGR